MTEQEAIAKMVAPGTPRAGKWRGGVIQIHVTRACDNACFGCTQGSNLGGKTGFMAPDQFDLACQSLAGYFGVIGVFGGNPALSPHFPEYCAILRDRFPKDQCGLWCNNPNGHGPEMRRTFNPGHSNLNVHLSRKAWDEFKRDWPESMPFGLDRDSRHAPVHLAMKDVVPDEGERWRLISGCDINQHWSAMIGVFRGEVRAWFCEVAGAQAILHQDEPDYPDTGVPISPVEPQRAEEWKAMAGAAVAPGSVFSGHFKSNEPAVRPWWQLPMAAFTDQVRKHCHDCGVPLRGHGELAMAADGVEQTSQTHAGIFKPKRPGRRVEVVGSLEQLGTARVGRVVDYYKNGGKK